MPAPTTFEIGSTLGTVATLASLDIVDPQYNFSDFSKRVTTGSGLTRGLGFPSCEWFYGYLDTAQYDALKSYCVDNGAAVVIATYNNARQLKRYNAKMTMPDKFALREKGVNTGDWRYMSVTITFTMLTEAE